MVTKPLRVLIIENSEDDLLLLLHELRRGGYEPVFERVETATAMKGALEIKQWDIAISDYRSPDFSGMEALAVLRESGLDIPFFLISGVNDEKIVAEVMQAGARDFFMKGSYARLVPAINRELHEARVRGKRSQAMEELRRSHDESEFHIRQLTSELEIANREMEAFCHTASHELRAPLSNIGCCCKVLMELLGNLFDE